MTIRTIPGNRAGRGTLVAIGLIAAAVAGPAAAQPAAKIDFGEPGPQWLRESESYAMRIQSGEWDALAQSKVKFITHCPINREFFARCHALGIRCFPYVTFYQGYASQSYQDVNLKDHPEFIEVDAQGNLKRTGFLGVGRRQEHVHHLPQCGRRTRMRWWPGCRRSWSWGPTACLSTTSAAARPCYGPKFGKHKHLYDDQNHAYRDALETRPRADQALPARRGTDRQLGQPACTSLPSIGSTSTPTCWSRTSAPGFRRSGGSTGRPIGTRRA